MCRNYLNYSKFIQFRDKILYRHVNPELQEPVARKLGERAIVVEVIQILKDNLQYFNDFSAPILRPSELARAHLITIHLFY